ncbi:hypothetical protein TNCV_2927141 [Trichonephila clavipes]|nr:hypothetical protein TNCV_2927141 [Trichonephila clavipes]
MPRTDETMILIYERKIFRFTFGGIQENETCGEEDQIQNCIPHIKNLTSSTSSKYNELYKWAGYVVRMHEDRTTKKAFNAQPIGPRNGKPNLG